MEIRSYPRPPRDEGDPTSSENFRAPGDAGEPDGKRRRSLPKTAGGANLILIRIAVVGVLGLVGFLVYTVIGLFNGKDNHPAGWSDPNAVAAQAKSEDREIPAFGDEESRALIKKVLAMRHASNFDGRVRLTGMSTEEAEDFLGHLKEREGVVERMDWLGPIDANGLHLLAEVVYFSEGNIRSRLAFLHQATNGVWQFDLASFARLNSVSWDDFVKGAPREAEVRAVCGRDSYFNDGYADEHVWTCYKLVTPDSETSLFAYAKKGSPEDQAMGWVLRDAKLARVMLQLKKTTGPGSRQCEVKSVIAQDWVENDVPYDQRFRKDAPAGER